MLKNIYLLWKVFRIRAKRMWSKYELHMIVLAMHYFATVVFISGVWYLYEIVTLNHLNTNGRDSVIALLLGFIFMIPSTIWHFKHLKKIL